jgi:hypothetical protein
MAAPSALSPHLVAEVVTACEQIMAAADRLDVLQYVRDLNDFPGGVPYTVGHVRHFARLTDDECEQLAGEAIRLVQANWAWTAPTPALAQIPLPLALAAHARGER